MPGPIVPIGPGPGPSDDGLSEWEHIEGVTSEEQELSPLQNTSPLRVFYIIIVGIALLLLLTVGMMLLSVFHVF
jgi:hypothetical protein